MTGLIFLDSEATGLELMTHDLWELGWAIDHEPAISGLIPHSLYGADPEALRINNYAERCEVDEPLTIPTEVEDYLHDTFYEWERRHGERLTVVGANPHFDLYRLSRRWDWDAPWAYRAIDVSVLAMGVFKTDLPLGLNSLTAKCREHGFDIPEPDHTAIGDVEATRAAFYAMRLMSLTEGSD